MATLTDLAEIKSVLDIDPDDHSEDKSLLFFIEQASSWIEQVLNRPLLYKERTEYYPGTGTEQLPLRARPVFMTPQVWVDMSGNFGSSSGSFDSTTELTYGDDFCLWFDGDSQESKNGILIRINDVWEQPRKSAVGLLAPYIGAAHGNIKVTYTGGYSMDTLPADLRLAVNLLVAKLRDLFPLGTQIGSESYEERSISRITNEKWRLLAEVYPILQNRRNWRF